MTAIMLTEAGSPNPGTRPRGSRVAIPTRQAIMAGREAAMVRDHDSAGAPAPAP